MKPFDLKKALSGHPVITKYGHKVNRIEIPYQHNHDKPEILVYFDNNAYLRYFADGKFRHDSDSEFDLFMDDSSSGINIHQVVSDKCIRLAQESIKKWDEMRLVDSKTKEYIKSLDNKEKSEDLVNHPSHYNSSPAKCECGRKIECIDISKNYCFRLGNVIKYIWRSGIKKTSSEILDLKKAKWYLDSKIKEIEDECKK